MNISLHFDLLSSDSSLLFDCDQIRTNIRSCPYLVKLKLSTSREVLVVEAGLPCIT